MRVHLSDALTTLGRLHACITAVVIVFVVNRKGSQSHNILAFICAHFCGKRLIDDIEIRSIQSLNLFFVSCNLGFYVH